MADSIIIVEFLPIFRKWFAKQTEGVQGKMSEYIDRIRLGNTSNLKPVRAAIIEDRIHFGAGIRIYFTKKAENHYIALWGGSDKKSQQEDIDKAIKIKQNWEADENEKNKNKS
ncbi:MAG: type II toxin-antitoxin system RelE/ParE family toxin [Elusimicrobiota bacterium]|jgi:putative addiction module killer protein|nr:type II toxin-antitoxin system RelE/ParE family toxin [Elusimicrobiota bacterium]